MGLLSSNQVYGDTVYLDRTHPGHRQGRLAPSTPEGAPADFGKIMLNALNGVNDLQQNSTALAQAMITDPDSVDVHDVTIAMSKANLAVSMTKTIVDAAIKAYREIIST